MTSPALRQLSHGFKHNSCQVASQARVIASTGPVTFTPLLSLQKASRQSAFHPTASPWRTRLSHRTAPPSFKMSTMKATSGHSEACCNIPPVVSHGYKCKGYYEYFDNRKTYVTGPADASKAVIIISDIFGFFEQTLQGADILAQGDEKQKYKVFIPDWFDGKPFPMECYPPNTEEKQKKLKDFFSTNPPPKVAELLPDFVKTLKKSQSSISKVAIVGMCWGGKVAALSVKASTNPFSVAVAVHPAMVDAEDTKGIQVPMALLASKDEPAEEVKKFEEALKVPKHVEIFADQVHGWMAARADLSQGRVKEEYERGYCTLLEFFDKHL